MIQLGITLSGFDQAEAMIRRISPADPGLGQVLGRAARNVFVAWFRSRNQKANRLGGERTFWWGGVANAVQNPVVDKAGEISIAISHPHIRQKVFGGTIVPRKAKALAIPVHAKAHGKSPRVFPNLAFVPFRNTGPGGTIGGLVEGEAWVRKRGKKKGQETARPKKGGLLLYVLSRGLRQEPDPEALPPESEFVRPILEAARDYQDAIKEGAL